jgi:hypothetical protein
MEILQSAEAPVASFDLDDSFKAILGAYYGLKETSLG